MRIHLAVGLLTFQLMSPYGTMRGGTPSQAQLPVREITVFKDGHAFVAEEGELPVEEQGDVIIRSLPRPVLGTFWPYASQPGARLRSVSAGEFDVTRSRAAKSFADLLLANPGRQVWITELEGSPYRARILPQEEVEDEEVEPNAGRRTEASPAPSLILLRTEAGVRAVNPSRLRDLVFEEPPERKVEVNGREPRLVLNLDWESGKPAKQARVGMFYLQKGIRWIPNYRMELDGKGGAKVRLQATLINEMRDFENATVNLVVGVPSFRFKETLDPVGIQKVAAQLSAYFQEPPGPGNPSRLGGQQFSNALMTQTARMGEYSGGGAATAAVGADVPGAEAVEDLHIYRLENLSLRRGDRMVVPVAEFKVTYADIHVLELPMAPPGDLRNLRASSMSPEWARLLASPKAQHRIRLTNSGPHPLTTGPVLLFRDGRVLAQSLVPYTPVGGVSDVEVTTAVGLVVHTVDQETERELNALRRGNTTYSRIRVQGRVKVTNRGRKAVKLEVVRTVMGRIDKVAPEGKSWTLNAMQAAADLSPDEWRFLSANNGWPSWWGDVNQMDRVRWKTEIPPGEASEFTADWHYFWR